MGCCCSCCHAPDIEIDIPRPPIKPDVPAFSTETHELQSLDHGQGREVASTQPDDQPPPYAFDDRPGVVNSQDSIDQHGERSQNSYERKELPWVIPLTSGGTGNRSEDSLAAAYASDFEAYGISTAQYLQFLSGLDQGLFASPTAEAGSVSAYIHSMFQDSSSSQGVGWHSTGSRDSSAAYITQYNHEHFHLADLHVEVLDTEDMKSHIDSASRIQIMKDKGDKRLDDIEAQRLDMTVKLEQKLLTSRTLDKQQKVLQRMIEKDEKYNKKALKAISKYEDRVVSNTAPSKQPSGAESSDGIFWLLVNRYEPAQQV